MACRTGSSRSRTPTRSRRSTRERAQQERAVRLAWAATSGAGGRTTAASPDGAGRAPRRPDPGAARQRRRHVVRGRGARRALAHASRWARWSWRRRRWTARCTGSAARPAVGPSTSRPWPAGWRRPCSDRRGSPAAAGPVGRRLAARRVPRAPRGGCCPRCTIGPWRITPSATAWVRARTAVARSRPSRCSWQVRDCPRAVARSWRSRPCGPGRPAWSAARRRCRRSLAALDGAGLAHIAAHGSFRSESPMFSSLQLADGPLTVDDIHRLVAPAAPDRAARLSIRRRRGRSAGRTSSASRRPC